MIIRKFVFNKDGKVEFTWEELKKLLDEVYLEGQESKIQFWEPPISYPSYPPYLNHDFIYNTTATTNLTNNTSDLASSEKESALTLGENSNA